MERKTILTIGFILSLFLCSSCTNEGKQREKAIQEILNKHIANIGSYEQIEFNYIDSIQPLPFDYECLKLSWDTYYSVMYQMAPSINDFSKVVLNGRETFHCASDSLTGRDKEAWDTMLSKIAKTAEDYNSLIDKVLNYEPHAYRRAYIQYRYKGTDDKYHIEIGRFYFNDKNEITKYLMAII